MNNIPDESSQERQYRTRRLFLTILALIPALTFVFIATEGDLLVVAVFVILSILGLFIAQWLKKGSKLPSERSVEGKQVPFGVERMEPMILRANDLFLVFLLVSYAIGFLVAGYFYITIQIPISLMILYGATLFVFLAWFRSIEFQVDEHGVTFKGGINKCEKMNWHELTSINIDRKNILNLCGADEQRKIRINYYALFQKRSFASALGLILRIQPRISLDEKTTQFLRTYDLLPR